MTHGIVVGYVYIFLINKNNKSILIFVFINYLFLYSCYPTQNSAKEKDQDQDQDQDRRKIKDEEQEPVCLFLGDDMKQDIEVLQSTKYDGEDELGLLPSSSLPPQPSHQSSLLLSSSSSPFLGQAATKRSKKKFAFLGVLTGILLVVCLLAVLFWFTQTSLKENSNDANVNTQLDKYDLIVYGATPSGKLLFVRVVSLFISPLFGERGHKSNKQETHHLVVVSGRGMNLKKKKTQPVFFFFPTRLCAKSSLLLF